MPLIFQSSAQGFSCLAFSGCRAIPPQPLRDIKHPELPPQPGKRRFFVSLAVHSIFQSALKGRWRDARAVQDPGERHRAVTVPPCPLLLPPLSSSAHPARGGACPTVQQWPQLLLGPAQENSKSLGSTLGVCSSRCGRRAKICSIVFAAVPGGMDETPGMEPGWGRVVPRAGCLSRGSCRSCGVERCGEDAQGTPCPQTPGTGAQSRPSPLQPVYPNSPPGALGLFFPINLSATWVTTCWFTTGWEEGESCPWIHPPPSQVGSAHGSVLPSHQVLLPNAALLLNLEKWCSLGSQIKGLVNTGRH